MGKSAVACCRAFSLEPAIPRYLPCFHTHPQFCPTRPYFSHSCKKYRLKLASFHTLAKRRGTTPSSPPGWRAQIRRRGADPTIELCVTILHRVRVSAVCQMTKIAAGASPDRQRRSRYGEHPGRSHRTSLRVRRGPARSQDCP